MNRLEKALEGNRVFLLLHPFAFAAFSVVFLFVENRSDVQVSDTFLPFVFVLLLAACAYALFYLSLASLPKAAVIASGFILAFQSFGHIVSYFQSSPIYPLKYCLLSVNLAVLSLSHVFLKKTNSDVRTLNLFLSVVSFTLVSVNIISILPETVHQADNLSNRSIVNSGELPYGRPDIYYIILDAYPREDTLRQILGFDNSGFLRGLEARGFHVANMSKSNYPTTYLSLASSLNMMYLDSVTKAVGGRPLCGNFKDRAIPYRMIRNSEVVSDLKSRGYTFINLRSGWGPTDDMTTADLELGPPHSGRDTEFFKLFFKTSALCLISDFVVVDFSVLRKDIEYSFDTLGEIPDIKGPTFTLAHIMSPHPPLLFNSAGEPVQDEVYLGWGYYGSDSKAKFVDQVIYINRRVEGAIDEILNKSHEPPVIIIQADHGTWFRDRMISICMNYSALYRLSQQEMMERMGILNAYYLPDGEGAGLYDSITPVNSFRLVLNHYFAENRTLLDDRSYFSCWNVCPYEFREVNDG